MDFEFDEYKSLKNTKKHGIDFIQAQALWQDEKMLEVRLDFADEPRWLCVGKISGKHWSAIITYRNDIIRIISVRRARKKEIYYYENC